jgi:hypothetical protein
MKLTTAITTFLAICASVQADGVWRINGETKSGRQFDELTWVAPAGDYYTISGSAHLSAGDSSKIYVKTNRRPKPLLDRHLEKKDPQMFQSIVLLNSSDTVVFGTESTGHEADAVTTWEVTIKRLPTVPEPWTPVRVNGSSLSCWNRTYDFSANLLPSKIKSGKADLLAAPIVLAGQVDGSELEWKSASFDIVQAEDDVIKFTTKAESQSLVARCDWRFEYDGFLLCNIKVEPKSSLAKVKSLSIHIPFNPKYVSLFHHDTAKPFYEHKWTSDPMNCGAVPANGLSLPFVHHIWIGDEERGLQWFAESDQGLTNSKSFIVIDASKTMKLQLLSDATLTDKEPFSFVFGLMASPVKPMVPPGDIRWCFGWQSLKTWNHDYNGNPTDPDKSQLASLRDIGVNCFDLYNVDWKQGDPYPDNPEIANLVTASNRYGMAPLTSAGIWVDRNSGGYVRNGVFIPEITWFTPDIPGRVLQLMCQRSSEWRQWFLDRVYRAFNEAQVAGIYLDGAGTPQQCLNREHGCGYEDEKGVHPTLPILPTRELMKQIYLISRSVGKRTYVIAHTSSSINLPCLSFADAYLEGEHVNRYPEDSNYTLAGFRAEMMGHPYGIPAFYLKYSDDPIDQRRCSTYALAHDMMPVELKHAALAWKAYNDFGTSCSKWFPYWTSPQPIFSDNADIKINTRVRPGIGALCTVANLSHTHISTMLHIDNNALGLHGNIRLFDLESGASLTLTPKGIPIELEPGSFSIIRICEEENEK